MHLQKIAIINYKNHSERTFEFSPLINCFTGRNGVGKTNILDAIYFLSFSKSFFHAIDSNNIQFEKDFLMLQGEYERGEYIDQVYIGIKRNKKKIVKRNQKVYKRLADHIGTIPLVMVSPADVDLVVEGSEIRRKFIDGVISQFNKPYLDHLLNYNKALVQRNALLKQFAENNTYHPESLEVWNDRLQSFAEPI